MRTLLISGDTLQEWDIEEVLTNRIKSKDQDICRMLQYEWDKTIGSQTSKYDMSYIEKEQFDNTYNNFK